MTQTNPWWRFLDGVRTGLAPLPVLLRPAEATLLWSNADGRGVQNLTLTHYLGKPEADTPGRPDIQRIAINHFSWGLTEAECPLLGVEREARRMGTIDTRAGRHLELSLLPDELLPLLPWVLAWLHADELGAPPLGEPEGVTLSEGWRHGELRTATYLWTKRGNERISHWQALVYPRKGAPPFPQFTHGRN